MKRKKNYVMGKLNTPKRVTLPDGRSFLACYERVPRSELPLNVKMKRSYKTRAAPKGRRRGIPGKGQSIFSFLKKNAKSLLVRSITKKGLEYAPGVYHNLRKRVKPRH